MAWLADGLPAWLNEAPEIVGVQVGQYKNLTDLWLRWDHRMVVIGPNGAGKTNLLDCLALLMGTAETRRILAARVPKSLDFDVSVVVRGDLLVVPPDDALRMDAYRITFPWAPKDADWLRELGVHTDESPKEAISLAGLSLNVPEDRLDAVSRAVEEGVVRYRLRQADGRRSWTRTLVTQGRVKPLAAGAEWGAFRALSKEWLEEYPRGSNEPYRDVLVLPERQGPPVDLQWLSRLRSDAEIAADLTDAVYEASTGLGVHALHEGFEAVLVGLLDDPEGDEEVEVDTVAWAVAEAEKIVRGQLDLTMPGLPGEVFLARNGQQIDTDEVKVRYDMAGLEWPQGGFREVEGKRRDGVEPEYVVGAYLGIRPAIGQITPESVDAGDSLVEVVSAGERRWFDEAMHAAAMVIREHGRLAPSLASRLMELWADGSLREGLRAALLRAWGEARETEPVSALLGLLGEAMQALPTSTKELREAVQLIQRLDHPPEGMPASAAYELRSILEPLLAKEVAKLQPPRLRVRVFDEPEAHLHARAVGGVADALTRLAPEADVVVASHHPRFLFPSGLTPYRFHRRQDGTTTVSTYDPTLRTARSEIAEYLGLNRPEALAGARAVLMVEGQHDMLVLAREPFATQLREAGIVALPMRGTQELRSEAVVEVVAALGPETVGVMIDNGVAVPGRSRSSELTQLELFKRAARDHGMLIIPVGLSRPDIIAYLNPKAVAQACHEESVDWGSLIREFRDSGETGFKRWLADSKRIDVSNIGRIQEVLDLMEEHGLPFESELPRKLEEFISKVTS